MSKALVLASSVLALIVGPGCMVALPSHFVPECTPIAVKPLAETGPSLSYEFESWVADEPFDGDTSGEDGGHPPRPNAAKPREMARVDPEQQCVATAFLECGTFRSVAETKTRADVHVHLLFARYEHHDPWRPLKGLTLFMIPVKDVTRVRMEAEVFYPGGSEETIVLYDEIVTHMAIWRIHWRVEHFILNEMQAMEKNLCCTLVRLIEAGLALHLQPGTSTAERTSPGS